MLGRTVDGDRSALPYNIFCSIICGINRRNAKVARSETRGVCSAGEWKRARSCFGA